MSSPAPGFPALSPRPTLRLRAWGFRALAGLLLGLGWCSGAWALPALLLDGPGVSLVLPLPSQGFGLAWEHSVERTVWRETFVPDAQGNLVLVSSKFSSAGAGLPDRLGSGDVFHLQNGIMELTSHPITVPELRVRLSGVARHQLAVGGKVLDLNAIFGECVVIIRATASYKEPINEEN